MREHWYLACVEVSFAVPHTDEDNLTQMAPGDLRLNVLMRSKTRNLNLEMLSRAQQSAQMQTAQKVNIPDIQFMDAVLTSMIYLGEMTEQEFNKKSAPVTANDVR